jgi:hypothetical protein
VSTIRLDRYAPEWALAIIEDLESGYTGAEAVARAAEGLRNQADEACRRAGEHEATAAEWQARAGTWICAADIAADNRRRAEDARSHAEHLAMTARAVGALKGEYIGIAGLLR